MNNNTRIVSTRHGGFMAASDVGNAWREGAGYMSNADATEYERIKVLLT